MTDVVFQPWPKIPRLNKTIVVTEKVDGTNAAISIAKFPFGTHAASEFDGRRDAFNLIPSIEEDETSLPLYEYRVYAQSRTRLITPQSDNFGFAAWVKDNAVILARALGEGIHFGEWWGPGIQRTYAVAGVKQGRTFSLFDTSRWRSPEGQALLGTARLSGVNIDVVPVLYVGGWFDDGQYAVARCIEELRKNGSVAKPGFMKPEGIVVYHTASGQTFKVLLENDDLPKGGVSVESV